MRSNRLFNFLLLAIVAMSFAACSKSNTQGKLIPANASFVLKVDGKSLSAKLPWEEIKQNPLLVEMNSDSLFPAALKSLLNNPDSAGIDTRADLLFFALKDSLGGYLAFEGTVKNEATFKAFNQKITENGAESEQNGIQFISKSPVCVGYNDKTFVYVFDAPQMSQMDELSRRMIRDSIDVAPRTRRDIGAACKAVFALEEKNSLAKNDQFTTLMKRTGDVHFWMNGEELSKAAATAGALSMINVGQFYKDNVTTGVLNFEDGKMMFSATTYVSEELSKIFKKYGGGKVNEEMIKKIPGKEVVAVMAFNFNPEVIREILKMTGLDGLINLGVQKMGFTIDDFIKANKGDVVIGVSDLVMKPDTSVNRFKDQEANISISQKPGFNLLFAASIADKESFNKLINAGKSLGKTTGLSDSASQPIAFNSNGTYFALSNKKENVDQYMGTATTDIPFMDKIKGESFGGYINLQLLMRAFGPTASKDSAAKVAFDASAAMWDHVLWKGGTFKDGGIEQTFEVNLVDKSTNSLKQLNQYAAKLSEVVKENKRKRKEAVMAFEDFESSGGIVPPDVE